MSDDKLSFEGLMRDPTGQELGDLTPPNGRYIPARLRKAVFERDQYACFYSGKRGPMTLFPAE